MSADQGDKDRADKAEQAIKEAMTVGLSGFADPIMTVAQYAPSGSTLGRDMNRSTAVGLFEAMRTLPLRLPGFTVGTLPAASAHVGALVFCSDGAAGSPIVAFSDGSLWKRCDTGTAVST